MPAAISTAIAGYLFYILTFFFVLRRKKSAAEEKGNVGEVLWSRAAGIVFFGLFPLITAGLIFRFDLSAFGLNLTGLTDSLIWILGISAFSIPFSIISGRNRDLQKEYPAIRVKSWTLGLLVVSAVSWMGYLLAYEFLLRGFLLFSCLAAWGVLPAVVINLIVYALFHIHKGYKEMAGSFFLGCILCLVTIVTKTIWAAWALHVVLALSSEWAFIHFNPEMTFKVLQPK